MINVDLPEMARKAREETFRRLAEAEHYARLARGFLEIGDDPGALYALARHKENTVAACREFQPLRSAMGATIEHRGAAE